MANTPNIGLKKLSKGERNWDQGLNSNFDIIDTQIKTVKDAQVITQAKVDKSESTLQAQINAMNVGPGVQVDPRVSQALVDSELETHENLRGRNTKWENRVIDIENDVNKVSTSNPESSYESAISLPDTATNGQISASVRGLTAVNLFKNGDFRNGETNWVGDTNYITDGAIRVKDTGLFKRVYQRIELKSGDKYYSSFEMRNIVKIPHISLKFSVIGIYGEGSGFYINDEPTTEGRRFSRVLSSHIDGIGDVGFNFQLNSSTQSDLTIKNVFMVNLTQIFGAGNEPTKEQCDKIFANYFDGTKSTISAMRLKSVGINRFNGKIKQGYPTSNSANAVSFKNFVKIKKDVTHRITVVATKVVTIGITTKDDNDNIIRNTVTLANPGTTATFSLTGNESKFSIYFYNSGGITPQDMVSVIVSEGSAQIPYESYKESNSYIVAKKDNKIVNLRSLPNGTKDEIRVNEGKIIKRVSDEYINFSNWTYNGTFKAFHFPLSSFNNIFISSNTPNAIFINQQGFTGNSRLFTPSGVPQMMLRINDEFLTNLGYTANSTGARKWANDTGLELTYQLAEPEIIPIQVNGNLESHPNGTIYVDKVHKDVYAYNVNIATHLPVDINGVESIHLLSGNQKLPVDLSKVKRTTNDTNLRITGHGIANPATDKFIVNTTRGNALRAVTYKDNNNLTVAAIAGQTVGDNIVKLDKKTNIVAEAGANEIQTVKLGGANTGKFKLKLTVDNVEYTTADISAAVDLAVTAQNIKQALIGLPSIGSGSTFLSSVVGGNIDVEFKDGNVGNKDIPLMELLPGEAFNGVGFSVEEKVKGGGTSNTVVKKTGHTLAVGDYIRNTTRGNRVAKVKSIVDANHFSIEPGIDLQATGDTIEVYKSLGSISADIDNIITIDGAENGETYEVEYYYPAEDSTNAEFIYSYPQNTAGVIASHGHSIKNHAEKLSDHDSMILGLALKVVDLEIKTKGV